MTSQLLNFSKSLTSLKNVAYRALLIKQTECIIVFSILWNTLVYIGTNPFLTFIAGDKKNSGLNSYLIFSLLHVEGRKQGVGYYEGFSGIVSLLNSEKEYILGIYKQPTYLPNLRYT